jgi:hypothetical protein
LPPHLRLKRIHSFIDTVQAMVEPIEPGLPCVKRWLISVSCAPAGHEMASSVGITSPKNIMDVLTVQAYQVTVALPSDSMMTLTNLRRAECLWV